ncbi:MAG TPA: hypothetical protein VLM83_01150 [Anaerolineales bacterium]|nr:hypothetical protein [Anaerolineales bacterium]
MNSVPVPPIDTQFYAPRLPISIVALPNDFEARGMREMLEMFFNCVVTIHWIGTPADFLKVLGQGDTAPRYLIISGHGGEIGYYLGEYIEEIDTSMLRDRHMPSEVIAPVVNLPGCTVLTTTCKGGTEAMGKAFVHTGKIGGYIGCRGWPDGTDMPVFLVNFFFFALRKMLSDREAWIKAMQVVDIPAIYQMTFYHADGTVDTFDADTDIL